MIQLEVGSNNFPKGTIQWPITSIFVQLKIGAEGDLCRIAANLPHQIISRKDGSYAIGAAVPIVEDYKAQRYAKKWSVEKLLEKNIQTEGLPERVAPGLVWL
jgi:hypothetical protein